MKKYVTGLVVGKFCPLHLGHESVIKTALEQCEQVIVLSYTSEKFIGCTPANRKKWLQSIDCDQSRLNIHVLDSFEVVSSVPNDLEADNVHRQFCADYLFFKLGTTVQAVFSSESYGEGFAKYLSEYFSDLMPRPVSVEHVMIDQVRNKYPISGTQLRLAISVDDYSFTQTFLSASVRASFVRKILFLGGESTGKTTITQALSKHFACCVVPEYGRQLYAERSGKLMYEDYALIAKTQLDLEDEYSNVVADVPGSYLFCDTSALTTVFYAREWAGRVSESLFDSLIESDNRYHKIYLCAPDFTMVQDGTRKDEAFRQRGNSFFKVHLEWREQEFTTLTGTLDEKIAKVIADLS